MIFSPIVHIIFNCPETGRITEPILQNPPHKIYYFTAFIKKTKQKDVYLQYMEDNIKTIQTHIPAITIIQQPIDYVDYIEIIQQISKIVKKEREENPNVTIYINISSGSKITAIASIEAAKIWDLEDYYVYSSKYQYDGGPMHTGDYYIEKPETFPTQRPDKNHIQTLKLIETMLIRKYNGKALLEDKLVSDEKFVYFKELIRELEFANIIDLERKNKEASKQKSALYMKAKDFLDPLEKTLGYITISKDKRNRKVYLTNKGEILTKIFRYLD
jgi:hypothetical protein